MSRRLFIFDFILLSSIIMSGSAYSAATVRAGSIKSIGNSGVKTSVSAPVDTSSSVVTSNDDTASVSRNADSRAATGINGRIPKSTSVGMSSATLNEMKQQIRDLELQMDQTAKMNDLDKAYSLLLGKINEQDGKIDKKIENIDTSEFVTYDDLRQQNANLGQTIADAITNNNTVSNLQREISSVKSDNNDIKRQLDLFNDDFDSIAEQFNENLVTSIRYKVNNLTNNYQTLNEQNTEISNQLDATNAIVTALQQDSSSIAGRVNALESIDSASQTEFDELNRRVNTLAGGINETGSLLNQIKTDSGTRSTLATAISADQNFKSAIANDTGIQGNIATALANNSSFLNTIKDSMPTPTGTIGADGKSAKQIYCENNKATLNAIFNIGDDCKDGFSDNQFVKAQSGAGSYCIQVLSSNSLSDTIKQKLDKYSIGTTLNSNNFEKCYNNYADILTGEGGSSSGTITESPVMKYCQDNKAIVKAIYSTVNADCSNFTTSMYNALQGGANAYCISFVGKSLTDDDVAAFARANKSELTFSRNYMFTVNDLNGCIKNYYSIINGKNGVNGSDGKTTGMTYLGELDSFSDLGDKTCNSDHIGDAYYIYEHDRMYVCNGTTWGRGVNLGERGKSAAETYCEGKTNGKNNSNILNELCANVSGFSTIGTDATACHNFAISDAASQCYAYVTGGAAAWCSSLIEKTVDKKLSIALSRANISIAPNSTFKVTDMKACVENYNAIISGETHWYTYCAETIDGTQNYRLTNVIKPLFDTVQSCADFTVEQYNILMGGAHAYCASLVGKTPDEPTVRLLQRAKNTSLESITTSTTFSSAHLAPCVTHYNEIMAGADGETAWHAYCTANGNLENIIQKLYTSVRSCSDFTSDQYNAIQGGPDAYCIDVLSHTTLTEGNFNNQPVAVKRLAVKLNAATENSGVINLTAPNKFKLDTDTFQNCKQYYSEIMSGTDGETAWHAYCTANGNLENIIKKLYTSVRSCSDFTSAQYNAIQGGPDAYCIDVLSHTTLTVDNFNNQPVAVKRLAVKLNAATENSGVINLTAPNKFKLDTDTFQNCKQYYSEIMSGENGDSVYDAWCRAYIQNTNRTKSLTPAQASKVGTFVSTKGLSNVVQVAGPGEASPNIHFDTVDKCISTLKNNPELYNLLVASEDAADTEYNKLPRATRASVAVATFKTDTSSDGFAAKIKGQDGKSALELYNQKYGTTFSDMGDLINAKITASAALTGDEFNALFDINPTTGVVSLKNSIKNSVGPGTCATQYKLRICN